MRKEFSFILLFGLLFLFLIQMAGTLVQSIYILDLMNTSLDEKALGVLFFFTPVLLLAVRKRTPRPLVWSLAILLVLSRGLAPYLNTPLRLLGAGLATGSGLMMLGLLLAGARPQDGAHARVGLAVSAGFALALSLSALLRTANSSIDISLTRPGGWLGLGMGLLLAWSLAQIEWQAGPARPKQKNGLTLPLLGICLAFTLAYFAFSAPAVIARWTGGSYAMTVTGVSLLAAGWAWLAVCRPQWLERLARGRPARSLLVAWNLAFSMALGWTFLAQRVAFPQVPGEVVVVAGQPGLHQLLPLALLLLLFPVVFANLRVLVDRIRQQTPAPADMAPGLLLGALVLVALVFINIFSNVWGYIDPVSTPFRGLYCLPFLIGAGGLALLAAIQNQPALELRAGERPVHWGWTGLLAAIVLSSAGFALRSELAPGAAAHTTAAAEKSSLVVMTYNIQAGNDDDAEPAYDRQLAIIRRAAPDVLALQESDTARISLNNNDVVRYFADRLGYYAYYGPTPVTGTFGTAILSRVPLLNPAVIFSYSDTDEIGTTEAEIEVGGQRFIFYNVHPDGSESAKLAFAEALLARAADKARASQGAAVIALGDFNSRKTDPVYRLMEDGFTNAWTSIYPSEISPDGVDMSGRNRIDHIFFSPGLQARNPVYILPPASATDHPVHWAEITW